MSEMTDWMADKVITEFFAGGASWTTPSNWDAVLFDSNVTYSELKNGNMTNEVSGGGYNRISATFTTTSNTGDCDNDGKWEFGQATDNNWGNVEAVGVYDNSNNELLMFDDDVGSTTIEDGDYYRVPAGDFDISLE